VFAKLKRLFNTDNEAPETEHNLNLASAALMMEVATIDQHYDQSERSALIASLKHAFSLSHDEASEIEALAQQAREDATSLHEFTRQINAQASNQQKFQIVEAMWRVAYADGEIDKFEEHIIRRACDLIYLSHSDFIRAKLSAKPE
jgi:uncharacterized tellurite resistance protein B-like protein